MSRSAWVGSVRLVGVVYGLISLVGGLSVIVLFVRVPPDLLAAVPTIGRAVVEFAPWLVATGAGASAASFLGMSLFAGVFLAYGLWALHTALFGADESFLPDIGTWLN